ncbi:TetR/AcrR family transcriptional regulator [Streptosporangium sp. NPDC002544]|uniref:TetR/AcrR family transcriptional regulator n=1 Tax=unclassified Streptosporangium TaxID=2632669 RepID=UPI0033168FDC
MSEKPKPTGTSKGPATTLAMKREAAAQRKDRARYGAKREEILKAAAVVLGRNGLSGTTVEAIAREAGLDRATVYYYFPDKFAIFREAIHDGVTEMVEGLERIAGADLPPQERLLEAMRTVMRAYERHYPQLYIYFQEGAGQAVIDQHLNQQLIGSGRVTEDLFESTVRDGMARGEFQISLPPKVFAKLLVGMLNWTSRWFVPNGALSAEDIADGMTETVLAGIVVGRGK